MKKTFSLVAGVLLLWGLAMVAVPHASSTSTPDVPTANSVAGSF